MKPRYYINNFGHLVDLLKLPNFDILNNIVEICILEELKCTQIKEKDNNLILTIIE